MQGIFAQLQRFKTILQVVMPMKQLKEALPLYSTAVANKDAVFKPLDKRVTKVVNGFASCGAQKGEVNIAINLGKKIKGDVKPATRKGTDNESISQSQTSMDMRVDNFKGLIAVLAANKNYKPNEADLQVAPLEAYAAELETHAGLVKTAARPVILSREKRNIVLYTPETGMVDLALLVKKYALSCLGSGSATYKLIKGLKFRNI